MDEDKNNLQTTQVAGTVYLFWPDFCERAMFAQNTETNEIRCIQRCGYIHKDLTVRKAIAYAFHLSTFRK